MKNVRATRTKSVTVRLDMEINDGLDEYRAETRFSKSLLVNSALNHFVHLPDESKFAVIKEYVILTKNEQARLKAQAKK